MHSLGTRTIVNLDLTAHPSHLLRRYQIEQVHLPVIDMTAPTPEQISRAVTMIASSLEKQEVVIVHCRAGLGRTGTVVACYLVASGFSPADAIDSVRNKRPGSIETREQEQAVYRWSQSLDITESVTDE